MTISNTFENKADFESISKHPALDKYVDDWLNPENLKQQCSELEKREIDNLRMTQANEDVFIRIILEKNPYAYPYSIITLEGYDDYVEDSATNEGTSKCSHENRKKIESLLALAPSQKLILKESIAYEIENGAGSFRENVNSTPRMTKVDLPNEVLNSDAWLSLETPS